MAHVVRSIWGVYEGNSYVIEEGKELRAGRAPTNDIKLEYDQTASGKHALLKVSQNLLYLSDLGSTNGSLMEGIRLPPKEWHRVKGFFVLGATVFVSGAQARQAPNKPLPIESATQWHAMPLYKQALAYAEDFPFISCVHIFLALLKLEPQHISAFLKKINIKIDIPAWQEVFKNGTFFSDKNLWLNKPLEICSRPTANLKTITPLAQNLLRGYLESPDPAFLFKRLIEEDFNMVYCLLDWQRTQASWPIALEGAQPQVTFKRAGDASEQSIQEYMVYKSLWDELAAISAGNRIPTLTGSQGCGKSYILRRMAFGATRSLLKPPLKASPLRLMDPKEFLLYNPPKLLNRYFKDLKQELKTDGLVFVDHLDSLVQTITNLHGDLMDLATVITTSNSNLVLACERSSLQLLRDQIPKVQALDLDEYLKPHLGLIHENMLAGFQQELGGRLSESTCQFYRDHVVSHSPSDLRRIKEFLDLCLLRMNNLGSVGEIVEGKTLALGRMGDYLMREVHDAWIGHLNSPKSAENASHEEQALLEIEQFLAQFSVPMIKIPLRYGPTSTSFAKESNLPRDHKLDILKDHLLKLMASMKLGFRDWFEQHWSEASPEGLKRKHGSNDRKLWKEYEELAKKTNVTSAEEELREACKQRWTDMKKTDLWRL